MKLLIVLRCGKSSIHQSWIVRARSLCDIAMVSYDDADFSADLPTYNRMVPGTKLTGIRKFFIDQPDLLEKYDYFWLLEDDLFVPYDTIVGVIDFVTRIRPVLCAPSLTPYSFYTHAIMIQCDSLFARGSDFVECMAPILSRAFFLATIDQLEIYPIYGIERYWQHLLWEMREVAYILDQFPIVHTRPVGGGGLYRLAEELGINQTRDDQEAYDRYGRPFNRYVNTIFGINNTVLPSFVVGTDLQEALRRGATRFLQIDASNREALDRVVDHATFANAFFSRFLAFESVGRLLHLPSLSEDAADLVVRTWRFGSHPGREYASNLKLLPDGRIGGYNNDNEHSWRMEGEDLLLLSRGGMVTTRFSSRRIKDNRVVLEGNYVGSEKSIHYLREFGPE